MRLSILTKAGHEIPVEISFGEFESAGRHIFSGVLRDVSDRVAAEATLAANAEQLQGQAAELEQQIEEAQVVGEELEQANEELQQANVALEIARADAEAAVARLRSQEAEYRALANSMPTLAWMAKPDGWILWYNERWYEYTGTVPADMEGWGWQRVHDPRTLPDVLDLWSASIKSGEPFEMTFLCAAQTDRSALFSHASSRFAVRTTRSSAGSVRTRTCPTSARRAWPQRMQRRAYDGFKTSLRFSRAPRFQSLASGAPSTLLSARITKGYRN